MNIKSNKSMWSKKNKPRKRRNGEMKKYYFNVHRKGGEMKGNGETRKSDERANLDWNVFNFFPFLIQPTILFFFCFTRNEI